MTAMISAHPAVPDSLIDAALHAVLTAQQVGFNASPIDVAKHIAGDDWSAVMPMVHIYVKAQARNGHLQLIQNGEPVHPDILHGDYCLSLPQASNAKA